MLLFPFSYVKDFRVSKVLWSTLQLWIYFCSGVRTVLSACNVTLIGSCYEELHASTSFNQMSGDKAFFPWWNDTDLNMLCRVTEQAEKCVEEMKEDCHEVLSKYSDTDSVISYVCGEGREEYVRSRDCISSAAVKNLSLVCHESYSKKQKELKDTQMKGNISRDSRYEFFCGSVEEFLDCVHRSVKYQCDVSAADWILHTQSILFQGSIDMCRPELYDVPSSRLSPATVYALVLGPLLLISAFIVGSLVLGRRFCLQKRRSAATFNNGVKYKDHTNMKSLDKNAVQSTLPLMPDSVRAEALSNSCRVMT